MIAPLEIRTIAFRVGKKTLIIITADLIGVDLTFTLRVRQQILDRHGISGENVLIAASHTHCGPAMLASIGLVPLPETLAKVEQAVLRSVGEALARLEPVTLGLGASSAHFNINRRPLPGTTAMAANYAGVVDRRVRILRVDRLNGNPLAVLFHYSCHPTTKNGSDGLISPDYPGVARAEIESTLSCRALFMPGCFGNIRPNVVNDAGAFISATVEQLREVGHELASAVCSAAKFTKTFDDDHLSATEADLFLPFGSMLPVDQIEQMTHLNKQPLRADWARRHLSAAQSGATIRQGENSIMQCLEVGPLTMVAIPGEPVQEIGHAIERAAGGRFADLWPVGYANDQLGYLCTPRMYMEGGYEPTAYVVYDRPAPYMGEAAAILKSAEELMQGRKESGAVTR